MKPLGVHLHPIQIVLVAFDSLGLIAGYLISATLLGLPPFYYLMIQPATILVHMVTLWASLYVWDLYDWCREFGTLPFLGDLLGFATISVSAFVITSSLIWARPPLRLHRTTLVISIAVSLVVSILIRFAAWRSATAIRREMRFLVPSGSLDVMGDYLRPMGFQCEALPSTGVTAPAAGSNRWLLVPPTIPCAEAIRLFLVHGEQAVPYLRFAQEHLEKIPSEFVASDWLFFNIVAQDRRLFLRVKRWTDLVFAVSGLLIVFPLMALIALLVKLDSKGKVLYAQERIGKNGQVFNIYKFRTMSVAENAPVYAGQGDSRITRVGKWLRRARMDELPQLINILRGEMSMVGPRPEILQYHSRWCTEIPHFEMRTLVPQGLTGWAQVKYPYGSTREEKKQILDYDLFYVVNASVALDLLIILKTIKSVFVGRGAR